MLVTAGWTAAGARSVLAEAGSLTLDDAWLASLARAESIVSAAARCGEIDSAGRGAVVEQIRMGARVLGWVVCASLAADTVIAAPLATVRANEPHAQRWQRRVLGATGVISAAMGLVQLLATLDGASPQERRVLAYVGGSATAVGGVFDRIAHSPSRPATDTIERMRALDLETDLRASVDETERAAQSLWVELHGMATDSCTTDEQVVWLARRYASALQGVSVIIDSRVAGSRAIARSCSEYPGFAAESRQRCGALTSHLDALGASWQECRWLFERSKRNVLDYLVLADRP